jgi:uncharacterized protein (UPF0332 family)
MNENDAVLIHYRLDRAAESLEEAELTANASHWNTCANRLYYACFYAVSALLLKHDMSRPKHGGVRSVFNHSFVKPGIVPVDAGKLHNSLFNMRQDGDYTDPTELDPKVVEPNIEEVRNFITTITKLVEKEHE